MWSKTQRPDRSVPGWVKPCDAGQVTDGERVVGVKSGCFSRWLV
ncbi:MAG TPA: hypothetical protein PLA27_00055 [Anaerolineales bacterium]|nr:hypothetical protein [Anaerolineales bacterium]HQX14782.1 hypothetical protein [Anaerolineales bacterium]